MMINRLSVAVLAVILGITMGSMTKAMYELKWQALEKLASPLLGDDGKVDLVKLEDFAINGLQHIKEWAPHPHDGPIWDLYQQLQINNTELGQCLDGFKAVKHGVMKWMGVAMMSGLKCKIQQFKGSLLQRDCAKDSMKECLPVMLSKAIKAKKMMHKVKYATKLASLTCSEESSNADPLSLFTAAGTAVPVAHHVVGPMCMMAAFSNMMDDDSEKEVCDCMRAEFEDQGIPLDKALFNKKAEWITKVINTLKGATTILPPLPPLEPELQPYDPFYAAQCIVQHCDTTQITQILSMTGLMDLMNEMTKIKEYFGDEMLDMAQKKCQCMEQYMVDEGITLPKIFQDYPDICSNDALMKNVLGMGDNEVEQSRQCANHIQDMLDRTIANMPDA